MGKLTVPVEAGLLIKGQIKGAMKDIALRCDLSMDYAEYGNFLYSSFTFVFKGDDDNCCKAQIMIEKLMRQVN